MFASEKGTQWVGDKMGKENVFIILYFLYFEQIEIYYLPGQINIIK